MCQVSSHLDWIQSEHTLHCVYNEAFDNQSLNRQYKGKVKFPERMIHEQKGETTEDQSGCAAQAGPKVTERHLLLLLLPGVQIWSAVSLAHCSRPAPGSLVAVTPEKSVLSEGLSRAVPYTPWLSLVPFESCPNLIYSHHPGRTMHKEGDGNSHPFY